MPVTTGRRTQLAVGVASEVTLYRPNQQYERKAQQIAVFTPPGIAAANRVWRMAPDAITLRPDTHDLTRLLYTAYAGNFQDITQFTAAGMIQAVTTFIKDTALSISADIVATGAPGFQKAIDAANAATPTSELTADVAALPKPPDSTFTPSGSDPSTLFQNIVPLDRVLASKGSFPANQGFSIHITSPAGLIPPDNFLTVYFGGQAPTAAPAVAGLFAVQFRGDGTATLWERGASSWAARFKFRWANRAKVLENGHTLSILPYARNRMTFREAGIEGELLGFALPFFGTVIPPTILGGIERTSDFYLENPDATGFIKTQVMTGAGILRVDIRRDWQDVFRLAKHTYPASGLVIDGPITLTHYVPQDTVATVQLDQWLPAGTSITTALFDADTNVALTPTILNGFLLNATTRRVYAQFTLATTDPTQTPVLLPGGYKLLIPGLYQTFTATANTSALVHAFEVDSGGFMPDQDTARLRVTDPTGSLTTVLCSVDGARTRINLVDPTTGTLISRLFEGETNQAAGDQRGTPEDTGSYPNENWRDYSALQLTSLWGRIARMHVYYQTNYAQSTPPVLDAKGNVLPWRVTDVLKDVFNNAGVPADELDIPDLPMRLFLNTTGGPFSYQLKWDSDPTKFIEYLCRDYLGASIDRDPNAGTRGLWRLIFPPANYDNVLLTVHVLPPGFLAGKDQVDDTAYTSDHTFCLHRNFREWTVKPEGSSVIVMGITPGGQIIKAVMNNPLVQGLQNIMGRFQPIVRHPDPAIPDYNTATIIARNIFVRACLLHQWVAVRTPLRLVTDSLDPRQVRPRPLRIDDTIQVGTRKALVRFCKLSVTTSDEQQMQDIQAIYVT